MFLDFMKTCHIDYFVCEMSYFCLYLIFFQCSLFYLLLFHF